MKRSFPSSGRRGFTRLELCATMAALALLAALAAPLLAATRGDSERAGCFNNLRRLGLAALGYADDHDGHFPTRALPAWPQQLHPYYKSTNILVCPSDGPTPRSTFSVTNFADSAPRSYILNGWYDYYLGPPPLGSAFPAAAIQEPAQTILFGEKVTESRHFWMDYWAGDDFAEVEQGRHFSTGTPQSGGSNYTLADGSVRLLRWGKALVPLNLWAVVPEYRQPTPN